MSYLIRKQKVQIIVAIAVLHIIEALNTFKQVQQRGMLNVYDQNLNQFDFQKIVENGEYTSIAAF
jgi:hypothetical protein